MRLRPFPLAGRPLGGNAAGPLRSIIRPFMAAAGQSVLFAAGLLACAGLAAAADGPVRFNRDIRPILAANCFTCHGVDAAKRAADLRLDERTSAVDKAKAIVPGKPDESPLMQRISSTDADERMPPPEAKKPPLSQAEVATLRRWIAEGAIYEPHWAYAKLVRPPLPESNDPAWRDNPIDRYLAAGYRQEGLAPQPLADQRTLARRVCFDLTGLPPGKAELAESATGYEKLVDRLLTSPQHAERLAMYWLDLVRYADTCGYHSDNERSVWMYRDYVIRAFQSNKRFDAFTVEQLAGDLLPGAGDEQRIASGYNRLLQTTEEGGAQAKEYTAKYAADRARSTAGAWLAQTMLCAQCHDHKYDPLTTKDFYRFSAFFADVKEEPIRRQEQTPFPSPDQAATLAKLDAAIAPLEKALMQPSTELDAAQAAWEARLAVERKEAKASKTVKHAKPADMSKEVAAALAVSLAKRSADERRLVAGYFRDHAPETAALRKTLDPLRRQKEELQKQIPTTLVTTAVPPRVTRILPRGNWMDDSGEIVEPAIPAVFGTLSVSGRATRLDLAHWLVDRNNPLVARVFVNRLWRLFFGQGLVRTVEDCGTQGALPSHPELLDWLACEFIDSGWDVRHMIRLMVLSRTYRLASIATPELLRRDPTNLWLARQGRFRLDAEMIRDQALAVSGLLTTQVGGPSAKPYQPAGYWEFLNFPKRDWVADQGPNQYRRGLYTFWQRTLLHPSLLAFDACTREESTPDRPRSNTPLQALTLLNDPTYVEAARVLAMRAMREGGQLPSQRLAFLFQRVLQRGPRPEEGQRLTALYESHLAQYRTDTAAATALAQVGQTPAPADLPPVDLAAWTSVSRVLLNLHETITRN